eukprot:Phypoly_transcript_20375.p2 GENE.Phypoly_transcript_20375~~Phypoly_transcript_20375.p2  ORF type:complete len:145 (+),score=27.16 Phypoly_transcript_20375:109-543(+)
MQAPITVICYGTLRQGFSNHHFLKGATFLGNGKLVKYGTMYNTGPFPILSISDTSLHSIFVEVYHVNEDIFRHLDMLEGYPEFYTRTEEEVKMENGEIVVGWVYHQNNDKGDLKAKHIIESGDWAVHIANKYKNKNVNVVYFFV